MEKLLRIVRIALLATILVACGAPPGGQASEDVPHRPAESAGELMRFSGQGDGEIRGESLPEGIHRLRLSHTGERNFIVKDQGGAEELLLVNLIGGYEGAISLAGGRAVALEVSADGDWTAVIEELGELPDHGCGGSGNDVSGVFLGTEEEPLIAFRHTGEDIFAVRLCSGSGSELLVNSFGDVEMEMRLIFQPGAEYFWEVQADGAWSIE